LTVEEGLTGRTVNLEVILVQLLKQVELALPE
jgi:hypothetical protein